MTIPGWKWPGWKWPGPRRGAEIALTGDPWPSGPLDVEHTGTPVALMLSEIEAAACGVYARHGLPARPGHYARSPRSRTWRFLSETLTAEERWAFVLAQKHGSRWRFGSLEDLGDRPDSPPDVRRAAQALRSCAELRARLAESGGSSLGETLETAIRLGAAWRQLDMGSTFAAPRNEPLRLTMPKKSPGKTTRRAKA